MSEVGSVKIEIPVQDQLYRTFDLCSHCEAEL